MHWTPAVAIPLCLGDPWEQEEQAEQDQGLALLTAPQLSVFPAHPKPALPRADRLEAQHP